MNVPYRKLEIPPYSKSDIAFLALGTILNAALTIWGLVWVTTHWHVVNPPWYALVVALALGLFLADFLSGLLHWAFDTWFDEKMAAISRMVVLVREHHVYPHHIFRYDMHHEAGSGSWTSLFFTAPVYGLVTVGVSEGTIVGYSSVVACIVISLCIVFMLQFHKLGHRRSKSKIIRMLQVSRLLMSPQHHGWHHSANHDVKYCLINGWADQVLDALGFWRWMERVIQHATGAVPRRNDHEWMGRYGRSGGLR